MSWRHNSALKADGHAPCLRKGRKPRTTLKPALSLKDTAVAARNEEHRLEVLEQQLVQQLKAVRQEKRDVDALLGFLERKRAAEPPI